MSPPTTKHRVLCRNYIGKIQNRTKQKLKNEQHEPHQNLGINSRAHDVIYNTYECVKVTCKEISNIIAEIYRHQI